MKSGVVPSGSLSSKDLRATRYLFSPKREADALLKEWMAANPGFMHSSTPAMKDLRARLEKKLREACEAAQNDGRKR